MNEQEQINYEDFNTKDIYKRIDHLVYDTPVSDIQTPEETSRSGLRVPFVVIEDGFLRCLCEVRR